METIRLILMKTFNFIGLLVKVSIFLIDLGGFLCAYLFTWIYSDNDDDGEGAGFGGWFIGTILWFILVVLIYNKLSGK